MKSRLNEAADLLERSIHFQEKYDANLNAMITINGQSPNKNNECNCIVTAVYAVWGDDYGAMNDLDRIYELLLPENTTTVDYSNTHSKEECVALMRRAAQDVVVQ